MCSSGGCQESELLESWGGGRATHRTPGHQLRRREEPGGLGEGGGEGDSGLVSVVGRGRKVVAGGSRSQAAMLLSMEDSSSPALYRAGAGRGGAASVPPGFVSRAGAGGEKVCQHI